MKRNIKFLDLKLINSRHAKAMSNVANHVINSGWYVKGKHYESFKANLSKYVGSNYVVPVGTGLDALDIILKSYIEIGKIEIGDEVLVPANTFIATALVITNNNLIPVFVEPNEETFNLDFAKARDAITNKTRVVMLVHLYGQICWNDEFAEEMNKKNILIIEDNAQALGSSYKGRKAGNLGDAAAFSFYPGKNLGALGDGGAISTNDYLLAKVSSDIANYGSTKKYHHEYKGTNSRLDEIQAGFLNVKLSDLDSDNDHRRMIAKYYLDNIRNREIRLPKIMSFQSHVFHLFVVRTKSRDSFQKYLSDYGIETLVHYPIPIHKQIAFKEFNHIDLKLAERMQSEILSLPISPVLSIDDAKYIVEVINSYRG